MEDSDFSDEFCRFIQSWIPTVDAAELLVMLMQRAPQSARVAGALTRHAEAFKDCGLVSAEPDGGYRYNPASPDLEQMAGTLASAWRERPVTLIRMIYALRDAKIKSFADAFRIRRE